MHLKTHLPWPPKELSPNARVHHMQRSRHAKKYREACGLLVKSAWGSLAKAMKIDRYPLLHLWLVFEPPDNRRRDDDNMIGAFKPGRDGIADALGIDDQKFALHVIKGMKHKGGRVKVTITDSPNQEDVEWQWGNDWPGEAS